MTEAPDTTPSEPEAPAPDAPAPDDDDTQTADE
jgi:hypothetical protein